MLFAVILFTKVIKLANLITRVERWLKVYGDVLTNVPFNDAVHAQYDSSKFVSLPEETTFLTWLRDA